MRILCWYTRAELLRMPYPDSDFCEPFSVGIIQFPRNLEYLEQKRQKGLWIIK